MLSSEFDKGSFSAVNVNVNVNVNVMREGRVLRRTLERQRGTSEPLLGSALRRVVSLF